MHATLPFIRKSFDSELVDNNMDIYYYDRIINTEQEIKLWE